MVRVFVAIELSRDAKQRLVAAQETLRGQLPNVRWVDASRMHVTLHFVGEARSELASRLSDALEDRLAGVAPVSMSLVGLVPFPDPRRARIVAASVVSDTGALRVLYDLVEDGVADVGLPPAMKTFRPHVTLARFRRVPPSLGTALTTYEGHWLADEIASAVTVFESRLTPRSADYRRLRTCPLRGTSGQELV